MRFGNTPLSAPQVTEVVEAVVVVVGVIRVIVFFDDFAGYLFDLAIFSVKTQEPVEPIISFVGFFEGVNVQEPDFDQVLAPGEFVETNADKLFDAPAANEETFHVTVVEGAAEIDLPVAKLAKRTTSSKTPPERRVGEEIITVET